MARLTRGRVGEVIDAIGVTSSAAITRGRRIAVSVVALRACRVLRHRITSGATRSAPCVMRRIAIVPVPVVLHGGAVALSVIVRKVL